MFPVATVHCIVSLFSFQNLRAGVNLQLWHGSEHKGTLQDNWLSWHLCKTEGQASQAGHGKRNVVCLGVGGMLEH